VRAKEPIAKRPRLTMVWIGPRLFEPGTAELDMVAALLDDEQEALLRRELINAGIEATGVSARFLESRAGSMFRLDVVMEQGTDLDRAVEQVDRVLELLRRISMWEERLAGIVARHERSLMLNLQRLQTRAHVLALYDSIHGDPNTLKRDLARYHAVAPEGVREAIRRFLDQRRVVVIAEPESAAIKKKGQ
jgi:zinc protease